MKESETKNFQQPANWLYVRFPRRLISSVKERLDRLSHFDSITLDIRLYKNSSDIQDSKGLSNAENPLLFDSYIFIQGKYSEVKTFFEQERIPSYQFMMDCAKENGVVEIPDDKMRALRQLAELEPERLVFLPKPFEHYADSNDIIRITTGHLKGFEGCIVRIDHDRKLVMKIGETTLAVSNIYLDISKMDRKNFEIVVPKEKNTAEVNMNLIEQSINQIFHSPLTENNVGLLGQNLEYMVIKARSLYRRGKHLAAMETLICLMNEMSKHIPTKTTFSLSLIKKKGKAIYKESIKQLSDKETTLTAADIEHFRKKAQDIYANYPHIFGNNVQ